MPRGMDGDGKQIKGGESFSHDSLPSLELIAFFGEQRRSCVIDRDMIAASKQKVQRARCEMSFGRENNEVISCRGKKASLSLIGIELPLRLWRSDLGFQYIHDRFNKRICSVYTCWVHHRLPSGGLKKCGLNMLSYTPTSAMTPYLEIVLLRPLIIIYLC